MNKVDNIYEIGSLAGKIIEAMMMMMMMMSASKKLSPKVSGKYSRRRIIVKWVIFTRSDDGLINARVILLLQMKIDVCSVNFLSASGKMIRDWRQLFYRDNARSTFV